MKPLLRLMPKNLIKYGVVIFWVFLFFCLDLSTVFSQEDPLKISCDMGYQIEGDKVTITVNNCNEGARGTSLYFIKIYKNGREIVSQPFAWVIGGTPPQAWSFTLYPGDYEVKLLDCGQDMKTGEYVCLPENLITTVSFQIEEQDSPTKLECGDSCLEIGGPPCPTGCPCTKFESNTVLDKNQWFCGGEEAIKEIARGTTDVTCDSGKGVKTALGCIPTEPMDLVKWLFPYLLGFGGLAAFGLIVFSGFQLMTSSGDPQKIQGAKETITSAVTGLIFIILSLFLLRLIGVNILGLPGLE